MVENVITEQDISPITPQDRELSQSLNSRTDLDVGNPFEILTNAVKVHTKDTVLNEDTTLANLNQDFPKFAEWVAENVHTIGIIKSYMRINKNFNSRSNFLDSWNQTRKQYRTPTKKFFNQIKELLMTHVQARLIVSRSITGKPLDAFLTYNRDTLQTPPLGDEKLSIGERLMGKTQGGEQQ